VTVGLYPDTGEAGEIFAHVGKGADLMATVNDGCILASQLLQYGAKPEAVRKSMALAQDYDGTESPASPIGAILATLEAGQ
jgi:hypothetical protein